MADIFVGKSEYSNLKGQNQYAQERAGLQMLALLAFLLPMLNGYRITINEARRPRPAQLAFWNAYQRFLRYGKPWAAVAAAPYTSKHDSGLAFDLGGAGGAVIADWVHALLVKYGPAYGIHWIGKNFGEKWHFEYVPGTAKILAGIGPTPEEKAEIDMLGILYRDEKTGEVAGMNPSTGWYYHCPNAAYVQLLRKTRMVVDADPLNLPTNEYGFVKGQTDAMGVERDQRLIRSIWSAIIPGYNGNQSAAARLAGIDEKANTLSDATITRLVAAIPAVKGNSTINVNEDTLADKIDARLGKRFGKAAA